MPYHSSKNIPKNADKLPSKAKQKYINSTDLTKAQKNKMMKHANHHNIKHITTMTNLMINNKMTFIKSHQKAMGK